jgi:hypothetical protein
MPINPSIIGNVMAPQAAQMPDTNAMLQTQTQGMENIYKIETARQQMAKEEAAAQQKAQEAATIKALLPAYTRGILTGDIADASNLVPPEMRGQLQPFIDALADKSPEEVRAALIGSLSSSPEGQEALAAIQRSQTYDIQNRQQTLAEQKHQQELATAGQPTPLTAAQEADLEIRRADLKLRQDAAAAKADQDAAIAAGEAPPVQLQKGEIWDPVKKRAIAAPGTEIYRKQKAEHVKDYKEAETTLQRLDKISTDVQELKDTTGWQKAFGTGAIMSRIPNTPAASFTGAYDFQTKYENLAGSVKDFGRAVAQMQGKLGNMAVQEWKIVSDAVAALDLSKMSGSELDSQLDKIATQIEVARNNVRRAYELEYGESQYYEPLSERGTVGPPEEGGAARPAGVGQDWSLEQDAQGNKAWVSPDRKRFIEVE